ncbi:MAG: DUF6760 family protein [Anaerolineae bacterium]
MRPILRTGAQRHGGVLGYPLQALYEEVAFIAFHFHWPPEAILGLEHADRRRWVDQISGINQRMNGDSTTTRWMG